MSESKFTAQSFSKDPEVIVRMLARAVIRRVQAENPGALGGDLRLRLSTANPFGTQDESMRQIWQEEIAWALQSQSFSLN